MTTSISRRTVLGLPPTLALGLAAARTTAASRAVTYRLVDLGTLGGHTSRALALNAVGRAVGFARTTKGVPRPVIWIRAKAHDLAPWKPGSGWAIDINDHGDVIAQWGSSLGAGTWYLWSKGHLARLPSAFTPRSIDNSGRIVGALSRTAGTSVPAVWYRGRAASLGRYGLLEGPGATATAIGTTGHIAGNDGVGAFLLVGRTVRRPPVRPDFRFGSAAGLGGASFVAGDGLSGTGRRHAAIWQGSVVIDLGGQDDDPQGSSAALAVNASGVAVGTVITMEHPDGHPIVWQGRVASTLPVHIAGPWSRASDINDRCVIAGASQWTEPDMAEDNTHAVLWLPTPG